MSKKSDIYAWGIILYQLVMCREPFKNIPSSLIVAGVMSGKLRPKWPEHLLPELKGLFESCMSLDPEARPSAAELVRALIEIENKARLNAAVAEGV